jgi:hypothetical protein
MVSVIRMLSPEMAEARHPEGCRASPDVDLIW